jgi:L-aspartate oxidase
VNADILELRNLVSVASLVVDCALRRRESRGLHHTLDYPHTEEVYCRDTVLRRF